MKAIPRRLNPVMWLDYSENHLKYCINKKSSYPIYFLMHIKQYFLSQKVNDSKIQQLEIHLSLTVVFNCLKYLFLQ